MPEPTIPIRRIYLASSWRNTWQPTVVAALTAGGHDVYDFRNPAPGNTGFSWSAIDPDWKQWDAAKLRDALMHPVAVEGHGFDHAAMEWATHGVLLLPSGPSAHLEAGWLAGSGRPTCVYAPGDIREPDLMYRSLGHPWGDTPTFFTEIDDVLAFLQAPVDYAEIVQPSPAPSSARPAWEITIEYAKHLLPKATALHADMVERDLLGRAKYGVPLASGNGRNALVDAYQEVLDLCVYLTCELDGRGFRPFSWEMNGGARPVTPPDEVFRIQEILRCCILHANEIRAEILRV